MLGSHAAKHAKNLLALLFFFLLIVWQVCCGHEGCSCTVQRVLLNQQPSGMGMPSTTAGFLVQTAVEIATIIIRLACDVGPRRLARAAGRTLRNHLVAGCNMLLRGRPPESFEKMRALCRSPDSKYQDMSWSVLGSPFLETPIWRNVRLQQIALMLVEQDLSRQSAVACMSQTSRGSSHAPPEASPEQRTAQEFVSSTKTSCPSWHRSYIRKAAAHYRRFGNQPCRKNSRRTRRDALEWSGRPQNEEKDSGRLQNDLDSMYPFGTGDYRGM